MSFIWPFFHKPQPLLDTLPMRSGNGQFAPSPKTMELYRKRGSVTEQLAIYCAKTPHKQRKAETEAAFALARLIAAIERIH